MGGKNLNLTTAIISVESLVPDFSSIKAYGVDLTETTWDEVLIRNGIHIDPRMHCLKSANRKTVLLPNEKVKTYLASFRKRMHEYKVLLTPMTAGDRRKIAEKTNASRFKNSPKKTVFLRKPGPDPRPGPSSADSTLDNWHGGISTRFWGNLGSFEHEGLHPDVLQLAAPERPQVNEDFSARPTPADFDDTASQLSQDSQMDLEDIKTFAVARLQSTSNSVLHVVRREIHNLKLRPNYMKISQYMPLTVHLVSHMLQEN